MSRTSELVIACIGDIAGDPAMQTAIELAVQYAVEGSHVDTTEEAKKTCALEQRFVKIRATTIVGVLAKLEFAADSIRSGCPDIPGQSAARVIGAIARLRRRGRPAKALELLEAAVEDITARAHRGGWALTLNEKFLESAARDLRHIAGLAKASRRAT